MLRAMRKVQISRFINEVRDEAFVEEQIHHYEYVMTICVKSFE